MEILCETSLRHVHLSIDAVEKLFGAGARLTSSRALSQPGQFLCNERVTIAGPKSAMENVAIIGPERKESQVEISRTDAFVLGIKDAPIRLSGETDGAPVIIVKNGEAQVSAPAIVARRHVHLDPETAKAHGLTDKQIVSIKFEGERCATLGGVIVRVHKDFAPALHIDADEANATLAANTAKII